MKKRCPISSINATILIFAIFAFCVSIFSSQIYAQSGSENAQLFRKNCERLHQAYGSGSISEGEFWFTTEEGERSPLYERVIAYCKLFVGNQVSEIVDDVTIDVYNAELNVYERDAQAEQYVAGFGIPSGFKADKVPVEFYSEPHGKQIQQATLIRQNGRCTVSMFGSAKINELWKKYHIEDTGGPGTAEDIYLPEKESTITNLHPGFNHDQEARLKAIMQAIGANMLNNPLCGGEQAEQQITISAENMREMELEVVEALVEATPREDDLSSGATQLDLIPEEQRKRYILPEWKKNVIFALRTEGQPEVHHPDGSVLIIKEGDFIILGFGSRVVTGPRTRLQFAISENAFGFLEQSSQLEYKALKRPTTTLFGEEETLHMLEIQQGSGRFKDVPAPVWTPVNTGGVRGTDYAVAYDSVRQEAIVEVYDGEVEVIALNGDSKIVKAAYGSEIRRVEISSDYQLTEKIAIPSSELESYVLSRNKAPESSSEGGNSVLFSVIILIVIAIGGGYFIYIRKFHAQK